MNEWVDDEVLNAAREHLNIPPEHWEDYAAGAPSDNNEIIRQGEPWDRPGGGHAIGFLAKFLGLLPLMEWAKGYDMKPTWVQDLIPGIAGNLPGPNTTAMLALPAAVGAVKWGERLIPNMFVYRGMGNPAEEVPVLHSLIRYAKHIIRPHEQSASLVTPKFLGTAHPQGVLFHGDVADMPAIGLADFYSNYDLMGPRWPVGAPILDVPAIRQKYADVFKRKELPREKLAKKEAQGLIDFFGEPARKAIEDWGVQQAKGREAMEALSDAMLDIGLVSHDVNVFAPRRVADVSDLKQLTPEQFAALDQAISRLRPGWFNRFKELYNSPSIPEGTRIPFLDPAEHRELMKVLGYKEWPLGEFSLLNPGKKGDRYWKAFGKTYDATYRKYPSPYEGDANKFTGTDYDNLLVNPADTDPENFLRMQADRFAGREQTAGPSGFYNEIVHRINRDIGDRLAGVRVNPLEPSPELLEFAKMHDLPVYSWPFRIKRPEDLRFYRPDSSPFLDLMDSEPRLGGGWADVRDIPGSPVPDSVGGRSPLTSTEVPPGFDYEYDGWPFPAF